MLSRRTVIQALAASPLVALLPGEAIGRQSPVPVTLLFTLAFRRSADSEKRLFDDGEPEEPGTVYQAFHEQWEIDANGKEIRRVSQQSHGDRYRILDPDSTESAPWTFVDHEGKGRPTVRLHQLGV